MASNQSTSSNSDVNVKSKNDIIEQLRKAGEKSLPELMLDSDSRMPILHESVTKLENEGIIEKLPHERGEDRIYTLADEAASSPKP
jgi:predicted transcriptional regulator